MNKFLFVLLFILLIPLHVNAQLTVFDAAVETALEMTRIDQAIHFGQMIMNQIDQAAQFAAMIENTVYQVERSVQNLASARDISSWGDFMDWYNRQLYYERRVG
jgi:hypothetical protein